MPKFFTPLSEFNEEANEIYIIGSDVNHIKNVLRKKIDDEIEICIKETGKNYNCKIIKNIEDIEEGPKILCKVVEEIKSEAESNVKITVYQGLPKADKFETIIQKCTELGVHRFVPLITKRTVVKLNEKDKVKKQERWQKIAEVAAKQCGRDIIPEISNVQNINELQFKELDNNLRNDVILFYEKENKTSFKDILQKIKKQELLEYEKNDSTMEIKNNCKGEKNDLNMKIKSNCEDASKKEKNINISIIIGPEGGFDKKEIEKMEKRSKAKIDVVTLGKRILRAETVAPIVSAIIMYELGDLN